MSNNEYADAVRNCLTELADAAKIFAKSVSYSPNRDDVSHSYHSDMAVDGVAVHRLYDLCEVAGLDCYFVPLTSFAPYYAKNKRRKDISMIGRMECRFNDVLFIDVVLGGEETHERK